MSDLLIQEVKRRLRDVILLWDEVDLVQTWDTELSLRWSDGTWLWLDIQEVESD